MPEAILSDYFYGDESEQFVFFKIPHQLITDPKFKHISTDAKLLYGMLLDCMSLSAKRGWYDDTGRVYIYYTVDKICREMVCGRDKAMKLLDELDNKKGIGLIERVRQGLGRPSKIYVKRFTTRTAPPKPVSPPPNTIKIRKKELPTRLERRCQEESFCIALYGISLKYQWFSLNLTEIEKLSVKLRNASYLLTNIHALRHN